MDKVTRYEWQGSALLLILLCLPRHHPPDRRGVFHEQPVAHRDRSGPMAKKLAGLPARADTERPGRNEKVLIRVRTRRTAHWLRDGECFRSFSAELPVRLSQRQIWPHPFWLPAEWRGYSVVMQQWVGRQSDNKTGEIIRTERGPEIVLPPPESGPRAIRARDIPHPASFTRAQWGRRPAGDSFGSTPADPLTRFVTIANTSSAVHGRFQLGAKRPAGRKTSRNRGPKPRREWPAFVSGVIRQGRLRSVVPQGNAENSPAFLTLGLPAERLNSRRDGRIECQRVFTPPPNIETKPPNSQAPTSREIPSAK